MTNNLTYGSVRELYSSKGYRFRQSRMGLNIFGIRSKESESDKFDDLGGCAWIDSKGDERLFTFKMTTDPGKHWLLTPMNKNGCIIMVPGQYIEVYGKGLHNGEYDCFKQIKPIRYVRDNNKNTKLDFDLYRNPSNLVINGFWGNNGTNIHRASKFKIVNLVQKWSAGCQVVQNPKDFDILLGLRDISISYGFKAWDYTLFEEL